MIEFIALNLAPIIFVSLVVFLLLGYPVAFSLAANGLMFFVIAGFAGFMLTGVQSVSRMMVSMLAPHEQTAEFYGLFAVAASVSAFIGPAVYGSLAHWGSNMYLRRGLEAIPAEQAGMRLAIVSIVVCLLVGLALLMFVRNHVSRNA